MITYTVKYKHSKSLFWKKIKRVKGDGFVIQQERGGLAFAFDVRFFILEDESRIEIPTKEYLFKFEKERHYSIKDRMSNEAGQNIRTDPR